MHRKREKDIFLSAIDIESNIHRQEYIARQCGDDIELLRSVEALLETHERPENVLDRHPSPELELKRQVQRAADAFHHSSVGAVAATDINFDRTGEMINEFRLMEKLGEGGFGEVYVAQQQQPVRRQVAIKLLKPGMDSKEVLARFEAERQALALMNHPNIAQVFDAGATPQGQPFIVLELVRGVPITSFCRKKCLPIEQRLRLFSDVCHAVHHAHQKGVIHRDLKPSNVLVTLHDTLPVIKVIDFGVAKALNEPLTEKTIYTRFAQLIGTPMYMSPEQAEMNAFDIDTRSDIYSLGVLLYELLTDLTPFDQTRMKTATFDEMRRMIREEEPPRPSQRLTTLRAENSTTVATAEPDPVELAGRLRGDLDWIIMKALDKDRKRRYDTAADFSRDVQRFLDAQPVIARPPSRWYRFSKFAGRNKLPLTAAALVFCSLVAGTTVSTWQAIRATSAQRETERLRKEAVEFAQRLKDANILLVSARANADQGRIPEAYSEYTRATQLAPDHFLTWAGRGSLLANLGAWHTAASDYARAIEVGTPTNDPSWWGVPQLCYYAGEEQAFEAILEVLQEKLRQTDDVSLVIAATRSICFLPTDKTRAQELANRLLLLSQPQSGPWRRRFQIDDHRPRIYGGRFGRSYARVAPKELLAYATALAYFRCGNAQRARELLEPILNVDTTSRHPSTKMAEPLMALVCDQLGDEKQANEYLARALDSSELLADAFDSSRGPFRWFDWLESHILLNEACFQITSRPLDPSSFNDLEDQALSLLTQQ